MTATETRTHEPGARAYVGALDGLRAIAVAAVIVFHFAPSVLPAGFLGVDVFFVVSGFLIARLVTREIERSGSVALADFWLRRARRLLPALATVTVVVLVVAAVKFSNTEIHDLRAQALGTLFYCANWVMIAGKSNYFTGIGRPSPFLHMWTLAVEEQFYVVLPLVMFAARKAVLRNPVRAALIAAAGAVASTAWMAVLVTPGADPSRAYLGSDSHAMGLLVGVALGVLAGTPRSWDTFTGWMRSNRNGNTTVPLLAAAALAAIVVTMRFVHDNTIALYRGGFLGFAVLCAVVIAVVVAMPDAPVGRFLRAPALVAIGLRSYSLYLWHWPVRVFVTTSSGLDGFALFVVRVVASAVLAEISYRLVERPFRFGRVARRAGSRPAVAYFSLLTVVAAVLVVTVAAPEPLPPPNLAQVHTVVGNSSPTALRVDTFGDSTALKFGLAGAYHAAMLRISIGGDARLGCGVVQTDHVSGTRDIRTPIECYDWKTRWQAALRNDPKARLMLMTGAWEILDHKTSAGAVVRFGTSAWTDLVTLSFHVALDVLTSDGRTAYLFEVPCYGNGDVGDRYPERSDPLRLAALNQILDGLARSMPRVRLVRWRTLVCPGGRRAEQIGGVQLWQPDEQHLTEAGAVEVWKWWLPQIR
ncbi:MAG TPA: acyltransferase [Acidimicrobiia bacterium]|nr:acyltransferase [Acidimicrobiia bacterium]